MLQFRSNGSRAAAAAAVALVVALAAGAAEARAGRSSSFGSRGDRTYEAPAPTRTAPTTAAPMERSATQPGVTQSAPRAGAAATPARGGMFGGGFMGGLMGGLLGAGLFGLLMGGGFFSGLGSLAGVLGFLFQILLVVLIVRLAMRWFQSRQQPAYAGAQSHREAAPSAARPMGGAGPMGGAARGSAGGPAPRRRGGPSDELGVQAGDYDAFERLLGAVQDAYSREDINALRGIATPEMVSYFAEELAANADRGVVNRVSDVRLLQGDLAEAWREGNAEYATVAMRYALRDVTVERATERVVEGDAERPVEVVELWTFRRVPRGTWSVSAIQQTR